MQESIAGFGSTLRGSQMLRVLVVGLLALVLQIPIAMIGAQVADRQERRQQAIDEVASSSGRSQSLTGPVLVIPYTQRLEQQSADGRTLTRIETRHAVFLPKQLRISGSIGSELRRRGIFTIPVYRLQLTLEGEFARPDFPGLGLDPVEIAWDRALFVVGIADARAIRQATSVNWNGAMSTFRPGAAAFTDAGSGIHAAIGYPADAATVPFSFPLDLNGSLGLRMVPFAEHTTVDLRSNHPHPSFAGNWLPSDRKVTGAGFEAHWAIPFLGRNYPQAWRAEASQLDLIEQSRFGVELVDPVDHYRMAERSLKYAGLFILLTFAAVWLMEVLAGIRVHPIQYLLLGSALCLFYLLELSLSEHLGFPLAYAIASIAVVVTVAGYSLAVLRQWSRALVVAAGVGLLYTFLYVLLMNEDYALLSGSIGLFLILAVIMYVTRRVDWYAGRGMP